MDTSFSAFPNSNPDQFLFIILLISDLVLFTAYLQMLRTLSPRSVSPPNPNVPRSRATSFMTTADSATSQMNLITTCTTSMVVSSFVRRNIPNPPLMPTIPHSIINLMKPCIPTNLSRSCQSPDDTNTNIIVDDIFNWAKTIRQALLYMECQLHICKAYWLTLS